VPVPKYRGKNLLAYLASYGCFLLRASLVCLRRLWRSELDAVHVHNMPNFLIFAALLPRIAGKTVILDIHDNIPERFAEKFRRAPRMVFSLLTLEERASALLPQAVICVNHPQRDLLVRHGIPAQQVFVSMNLPDPRLFPRGRAEARDASCGSFRLIYHGTMVKRLGVDLVLHAVRLLSSRIPNIELHLWGGGDDLEEFQDLAASLGVGDRVRFKPGGVPLEKLHRELSVMHVGVIGNRRNSATQVMLPVKMLEYVTLGIPVVAPKLKAIQYYFPPESVAYYEPDNSEAMAEAIEKLWLDAGIRERQSRKALEFVDTYCWEKQGKELVDLYRSLSER